MSKINYWKVMTRKKPMPVQECEDTKFNRVFGTFDLTALGVSATLGVGVYVLAGHVAKIEAGPSVILSFFIAAAASFLAGKILYLQIALTFYYQPNSIFIFRSVLC
jgi:L-asparagine transporter-like permease